MRKTHRSHSQLNPKWFQSIFERHTPVNELALSSKELVPKENFVPSLIFWFRDRFIGFRSQCQGIKCRIGVFTPDRFLSRTVDRAWSEARCSF